MNVSYQALASEAIGPFGLPEFLVQVAARAYPEQAGSLPACPKSNVPDPSTETTSELKSRVSSHSKPVSE